MGFSRTGRGSRVCRRALPLSVDVVSAAAGADGERLPGKLFVEGRAQYVADEVVGEVAAEADLAVRLDLREVPGDRAQVVAEGPVEVGKIFGDLPGRYVRDEGDPGAPARGVRVPPAPEVLQELDEIGHLLRLGSLDTARPGEFEALPGRRRDAEGLPHDVFVLGADVFRDEPA